MVAYIHWPLALLRSIIIIIISKLCAVNAMLLVMVACHLIQKGMEEEVELRQGAVSTSHWQMYALSNKPLYYYCVN
jgi:hypothetical protein